MAAAPKQNLGKIPCPCCGEPVALKKSGTGKLSYACQEAECEATGYADQHSAAARKWLGKLPVKAADAAPAPAAKPAPKPIVTPPPAPKPAASPFDLARL